MIVQKVKSFIPLSLKVKIRSLIATPVQGNTFDGIYNHLTDVKEENYGYDNAEWIERYKAAVVEKFYKIQNEEFKSEPLSPIYNLYSLFVSMLLQEKDNAHILDFGGGFGTNYLDLKNLNLDKKISYTIVDRIETIKKTADLPYADELSFRSDIPSSSSFDLIYCGSVLQYLPDYREVVKRLAQLGNKYFFITNNFMGSHSTFATKQVNMSNKVVAYWIFDKQEIINLLEGCEYKLIYQSYNYQPFHDMKNFPIEYQANDTVNLLFKKHQ